MYKNYYNFNITTLIKIRLHLGHKEENLNFFLTSYIYGTRHNINIFDLNKLWKPYRYLFQNLTYLFSRRNSFFLIGTNKNLPMPVILEKWFLIKPFYNNNWHSYYISGYIDRKWVKGLFTNWKIFREFMEYLYDPSLFKKKKYRFQKYFFFLKGIENLFHMPIPDFFIFLDKNEDAMFEIKKLQIPFIGLVDSDINPTEFLFKFFGNNDSILNITFFLEFLKQTIVEGRLKEQQEFFFFFLYKLQVLLKKKGSFLKKKRIIKKKINKNKKSSTKISIHKPKRIRDVIKFYELERLKKKMEIELKSLNQKSSTVINLKEKNET